MSATAVVMRNSRQGAEPPAPPTRHDGSLYAYAMVYDGRKRIAYADTPAVLLAVLIPGYDEQDEQGRLVARIRLAYAAAVAVQAMAIVDAAPTALTALTVAEWAVLMRPAHDSARVDVWASEVPLVLVRTAYAPTTATPQPVSGPYDVSEPPNLLWIDPVEEIDLLLSLGACGWLALHMADPY